MFIRARICVTWIVGNSFYTNSDASRRIETWTATKSWVHEKFHLILVTCNGLELYIEKTHIFTRLLLVERQNTFFEKIQKLEILLSHPSVFKGLCEYYWNLKMCEKHQICMFYCYFFIVFQRGLAVFRFFKLPLRCLW